jgi:SAM-dependent methyltransferase
VRIITGERAVTAEKGFNPAFQRHVSAYGLTGHLLRAAPVVIDVGCGTGHSFPSLGRPTVGVDLSWQALRGQGRPTVVADLRALPFQTGSVQGLISSHSIEHVPDPQRGLVEFARVLHDEGVAIVITPNRLTFGLPEEVVDPYHYLEFDPQQLGDLCRIAFGDVQVLGLRGSARYQRIVAEERRTLDRLVRFDRLRLRQRLPRPLLQRAYDIGLTLARRRPDAQRLAITSADFTLSPDDLDTADDLVAICRLPRRPRPFSAPTS